MGWVGGWIVKYILTWEVVHLYSLSLRFTSCNARPGEVPLSCEVDTPPACKGEGTGGAGGMVRWAGCCARPGDVALS